MSEKPQNLDKSFKASGERETEYSVPKSWISVVGIGDDGEAGLAPAVIKLLEEAEVLIGGKRQLALVSNKKAQRICWPKKMAEVIDDLPRYKGRNLVIVASGNPLHFGVGSSIIKRYGADAVKVYPHISALYIACAVLGWSVPNVTLISVCGRPSSRISAVLWPYRKIMLYCADGSTPHELAEILCSRGYGSSQFWVLEHLGGASQNVKCFRAMEIKLAPKFADLVTVAVLCKLDKGGVPLAPGVYGLPDDAFEHDGQLTKQEFRALALSWLQPVEACLLWDLGAGAGSISIEWCRMHPDNRAFGVERNWERLERGRANAERLGVPHIEFLQGESLELCESLPPPDAIFIGGGLSQELIDKALVALLPGGRLVCHCVTLESELLLIQSFQRWGGKLRRIGVDRAGAVGQKLSWRPAMPVMAWVYQKPWEMGE